MTGKSIQDIISMDMNDVVSLNESDLRSLVNRLVSASNKRLRRLEKSSDGRYSPAFRQKFSSRGKSRNLLLREFSDSKRFLISKTSTVRGWNKYRDATEERLGGRLPKNQRKKFWRVYRKFQESHQGGMGAIDKGSERMQKYIREMYIDNHVLDEDTLLDMAEKKLDEEYMKSA